MKSVFVIGFLFLFFQCDCSYSLTIQLNNTRERIYLKVTTSAKLCRRKFYIVTSPRVSCINLIIIVVFFDFEILYNSYSVIKSGR